MCKCREPETKSEPQLGVHQALGFARSSALEIIMHMPRDRQLAAKAESNAAAAVTRVVRSCAQELSPF